MKFKFLSLFVVLSLILGLGFMTTPVKAVGYGTNFQTSITYMNVGTDVAQITVEFYEENGTTVKQSYQVADLKPGAASSLLVGTVFTNSFKGSAVMNSNQPLVATMVQLPMNSTTVKNRPMSNGFSQGSTSVLIPTVLKAFYNTNSVFSVQNAGTVAANVTVSFIPSSAGSAYSTTVNLAAGGAKYFDMGTFTNAGASFNGSVRITSAQPVVASSMELLLSSDAVYAFEGFSGGATTVYMPSAMCKYYNQTSNYAIQNTSASTATNVIVKFVGKVGTANFTKTYTLPNVGAGAKASIAGCGPDAAVPATFIGSATITATQPVVAVAKIAGAGSFIAAHNGVSTGAAKVSAPYVRYSEKFFDYTNSPSVQQTNIAIQNIGAEIPAGQLKVSFVDATGVVKGTYVSTAPLAAGAKISVSPKSAGLAEFGYVADPTTGKPKSFGGGAVITGPAGSSIAAVVRVSTSTAAGLVAEDYNAIP